MSVDRSVWSVPLRHGLETLWPSVIADQWYCELKTHLKYEHPELEFKFAALDDGGDGHAAIASIGVPTPADVIEADLAAGKPVEVFEWILEGEVDGVKIRGKPDLIDVAKREARLVYEFKFSRSDKFWPSYDVQAWIYALLLGANGFAVDKAVTAIVLFPSFSVGGGLDEAARGKAAIVQSMATDGTLAEIVDECKRGRTALLQSGATTRLLEFDECKVRLQRFDAAKATEKIRWAWGYWTGEREPLPVTKTPGKCRACPMNAAKLCNSALAPPHDSFSVRRNRGRITVTRKL